MEKSINNLRTIKINITDLLTDLDKDSIRKTIIDSSKIFDYYISLGNLRKSTSYQILHNDSYEDAKNLSPDLPTAIIQQTAKMALASVKSWNSNTSLINSKREKYNKKALARGWKTKPLLKKWECPGNKTTNSYPINLLSLSRRGNLTTFSSSNYRIRILHNLPFWFLEKYPIHKLQAGNIVILKNKKFYIHLTFKIPITENSLIREKVIGIDRGINNIIALSSGQIKSSNHILKIKQRNSKLISSLQSKGTRSAKRHLKKLSGREKRFMKNENHILTKRLSLDSSVKTYVLEDLKGIRDQKSKGKTMNRLLNNWAFDQFQFQLEYKCLANGIEIVYVDPAYTSQTCSVCKARAKENRRGEVFKCIFCGHENHADINAAKNIRDNFIRVAFNQPIVAIS